MSYNDQAPCDHLFCHGAGHQTRSRCQMAGPHSVHRVEAMGRVATWTDSDEKTPGTKFSGFFNEFPEAE